MKRIRIHTGARLHFGLVDTRPPFGGFGVMIRQPETVVEITPAESFQADRSIKSRAYPIAQRLCRHLGRTTLPEASISVPRSAPAHAGLGSGTQLSLAIAEGLTQFLEQAISNETLAAEIAERGKRSAVGVHGYFGGGMIFESEPEQGTGLNSVDQRIDLPEDWRVAILTPRGQYPAVSGDRERRQFDELERDADAAEALRRRIDEEVLPAARAADFSEFARALEAYNHQSGMLFRSVQGGAYNGPVVAELVDRVKSYGGVGVGQSSWGPSVFAWCEDSGAAERLIEPFGELPVESLIAEMKSDGRRIETEPA